MLRIWQEAIDITNVIKHKVPGKEAISYGLQGYGTNSEYDNNQLNAFESKFPYKQHQITVMDMHLNQISPIHLSVIYQGDKPNNTMWLRKKRLTTFSILRLVCSPQTAGVDTGTQQQTSNKLCYGSSLCNSRQIESLRLHQVHVGTNKKIYIWSSTCLYDNGPISS